MSGRYAVLLAGGVGSRLAPYSAPEFPKQFFRLPGHKESLLQQTAREAAELVGADRVLTVAPEAYLPRIRQELSALSPVLAGGIIVEPQPSGTAGAAWLAARHIGGDAVLWLLPCDHVRGASLVESAFSEQAFAWAEEGWIVAFGLYPEAPSSEYGYLVADGKRVVRFVEKPARPLAEQLIATDAAWWNSGMFTLRADVLRGALERHAPQVLAGRLEKPLSIDHAIMEQAENLAFLPLMDDDWNDIGSLAALTGWWQANAPQLTAWDFGNGRAVLWAELAQRLKMRQKTG